MFRVKYSRKAVRDIQKLKSANLDKKAKALVDLISRNPYQTPLLKNSSFGKNPFFL
jgi:mRNA-degrading endonuclease RelE of RelBE toxin-antitoxin system